MSVLCRMPVQYVIEEWDFRDLTLKMRPPVFIPRPETEVKKGKTKMCIIKYAILMISQGLDFFSCFTGTG